MTDHQCCICYDDICSSELINTPCGHHFHNKCLTPWLLQKVSCPMCRNSIGEKTCEDSEEEESDTEFENEMVVDICSEKSEYLNLYDLDVRDCVIESATTLIEQIDDENMQEFWQNENGIQFTKFKVKSKHEMVIVNIDRYPDNYVKVEIDKCVFTPNNKKLRRKNLKTEKWRSKKRFNKHQNYNRCKRNKNFRLKS